MSTTQDYDYDSELLTNVTVPPAAAPTVNITLYQQYLQYKHQVRLMYLAAYCIVVIMGVTLNFTIMLICCRKYESFQKVVIWILALAVTHLLSCVSVVFQFLYAYNDFEWKYGAVSCKLSSYIIYSSMFSTATMLSLWSVSTAISKSPCTRWCKNLNMILISFSWTFAAVLAMPSLFSREIQNFQCIDDFDLNHDSKPTAESIKKLKAVVISRFLFGLLIPAFVMFVSCLCQVSKSYHHCDHCKKQTQIICAVKVAYFVSWSPQIFLTLIQGTSGSLSPGVLEYGLPASTALATTHCFTCPLIYILVGCSNKMQWFQHDPDHTEIRTETDSMPLQRNNHA
ncbi:chemerin-like receptor 1 [Misgurnus anguillicaudatus]|uniref:chemerin-like receptor 1 n=1 Tax=Misgurnus anguillicaudatus TaxID=75329 RepID=UPI003CCF8676